MKASPFLLVICGSNGAGKTTLAKRIALNAPDLPFIDPDEIARQEFGTGTTELYQAAIVASELRRRLFDAHKSFAFETVLSDPVGDKIDFIRRAREAGYFVMVHFVGLESPELSQARVVQRVHEGGHDVPDEKLFARYPRTLMNLRILLPVPDELTIYDNSSEGLPFRVIAKLARGVLLELAEPLPAWASSLDFISRKFAQTKILQ